MDLSQAFISPRMIKYEPLMDDNVDVKLAEFINSHAHKQTLVQLFERETNPNSYLFGVKRIRLSADDNGKLSVRVGGGYLSLSRFIEEEMDR